MTERRWLLALGLSMLLHALVVSSPGWHLPFLEEPEPSSLLEARLAPKPALRPAPAAAPVPAVPPPLKPRARPAPPQAVPAAEPAAVPVQAPPQPVAEEPAAAAGAATERSEIAWPRQGRIRFTIMRGEGEQATLVGQSTHTWRHDGDTYSLQTVTETVGLAALFHPAKVMQASEGRLKAEGIVPREFRVERMGQAAERALFDWEGMKVVLYAGERIRREAALATGAQDILSQIYQIGLAGASARIVLMIATGKSYGRYVFETAGEETLATRFGELRAWHLKTPGLPGEQAMELWLASDYSNLPLRIRYTDRKGEVFDQSAVELEADGARLATKE